MKNVSPRFAFRKLNEWREKQSPITFGPVADVESQGDTITMFSGSIEHKPHNCDWDSAPLGNKHCHYKSIVTLYDSVGVVIRHDNVTPTKIHVEWERIEE